MLHRPTKPKFDLGAITWTSGIQMEFEDTDGFEEATQKALDRHASCDWGPELLSTEDLNSNEWALKNNERLLSAYEVKGEKIWIITERDRSATTILFPDEY